MVEGDIEGRLRETDERLKTTEQELLVRNKFLNAILDSLTHPLCVIDVNNYAVQIANSAAYSGKLPKQMTCYKLFYGRDVPCADSVEQCPIEIVKQSREAVVMERTGKDKQGKIKNTEIHGYPIFDEAGRVKQIVEYSVDVTKRKRAERLLAEEHHLLRTLLDNMPDLIYVKDKQSRFVVANEAVAKFMGASGPDELLGKTDFDYYSHTLANKFYERERRVVETGEALINKAEFASARKGDAKWLLTTKVPWRDKGGRIVGTMGIGRDITELKHTQDALKASNQQLQASEQQLRATNQQLEATNQQLQASQQQLRAANQQLQASEQQLRAANQQLEATNQQLQASQQQLKASNQQLRAGEEELRRVNDKLLKRIRELDCLYSLSRLDRKRHLSFEKICKELVGLIPAAMEYPDVAVVRILYDGGSIQSTDYQQTKWKQSADIIVNDKKAGVLEVCYLEDKPRLDAGPFYSEELELLGALAEHLGEIIERKDAEQRLQKYQVQLKSLATELSLTEERERRRIAAALHDKISQQLVISKVRLKTACQSISESEIVENLNEVCNCLDQIIQDTRSLTFDLSYPLLHELGLETAIAEWLTEYIQAKHGIKCEFIDDGKLKPLDDNIRAVLFRNVRELLINVVKHAKASEVKVTCSKKNGRIQIVVEDNGVGFDAEQVTSIGTEKGGFGLFSIRERLEQIGGLLEIRSKPGAGTRIAIEVPLSEF
jgi:PAS domain S-box-containing protein